jgi:hypothetical protein
MDSDFEKLRAEHDALEEKNRAEIAALCADLERSLASPAPGTGALERQGDLLDRLFTAVMRHNLQNDKRNGYIDENRIGTALRIQKQCVDTLKAAGALDYMKTLALPRWPVPLPPPPQIREQTSETEKA